MTRESLRPIRKKTLNGKNISIVEAEQKKSCMKRFKEKLKTRIEAAKLDEKRLSENIKTNSKAFLKYLLSPVKN